MKVIPGIIPLLGKTWWRLAEAQAKRGTLAFGLMGNRQKHSAAAAAPAKVLEQRDLEHVATHMRQNCKSVIVLTGAGLSTSSGIPDFRTPGTGLYDNLEKYRLPYPEAIFDMRYFKKRPEPFFTLAKELYPGNFPPTLAHYFIRLLADKKMLKRNYTQNIDALERLAGIDPELLVEAHGAFADAHCIRCNCHYSHDFVKELVFKDEIPKCTCGGLVKPDIVFFGESLPERFNRLAEEDFDDCDLLIVMGTSLQVGPFNMLVNFPSSKTPRLLVNLQDPRAFFDWTSPCNRDVQYLGTCDKGCLELAKLLGWEAELVALQERELARLQIPPRPARTTPAPDAKRSRDIIMPSVDRESESSDQYESECEWTETEDEGEEEGAESESSESESEGDKSVALESAERKVESVGLEEALAAVTFEVEAGEDKK